MYMLQVNGTRIIDLYKSIKDQKWLFPLKRSLIFFQQKLKLDKESPAHKFLQITESHL